MVGRGDSEAACWSHGKLYPVAFQPAIPRRTSRRELTLARTQRLKLTLSWVLNRQTWDLLDQFGRRRIGSGAYVALGAPRFLKCLKGIDWGHHEANHQQDSPTWWSLFNPNPLPSVEIGLAPAFCAASLRNGQMTATTRQARTYSVAVYSDRASRVCGRLFRPGSWPLRVERTALGGTRPQEDCKFPKDLRGHRNSWDLVPHSLGTESALSGSIWGKSYSKWS